MQITLAPELLRWARERARLEQDELARKLNVKVERVREWEQSGELKLKQAEALARKTHVPFGYLFLREPPEEKLPVEDFRTVAGARPRQPSPDLLDVIYDAQEQQDWYRDYLIEQGGEPLLFVGSATLQAEPAALAEEMRGVLGWRPEDRASADGWEKALGLSVEQAERSGVVVQRRGIVGDNTHRPLDVQEFRGLALADRYAPFVLINSRDARGAQLFTLAHEMVHIWLGVSAVSDSDLRREAGNKTERFCNAVAAELLVPGDHIRREWPRARSGPDYLPFLVRIFTVSSLVILRRLLDLDLIPLSEFRSRYDAEVDRFQRQAQTSSGGGNFYRTKTARLGNLFARSVLESSLEGGATYKEAMDLLGLSGGAQLQKYARALGMLTRLSSVLQHVGARFILDPSWVLPDGEPAAG